MHKKIGLLFLFSMWLCYSWAYQLRGKVIDEAGEPMPYVTVIIKNTTYAVATNLKGEYFMELKNGNYTIVFSFLGYQKVEQSIIINGKSEVLNAQMQIDEEELEELVVEISKRDYAFEIIHNAIKARETWRNQYNSYTCDAYVKASVESDPIKKHKLDSIPPKEKLDFVESYSHFAFEKPGKYKETKMGYRDFSKKMDASVNISFNMEQDGYASEQSMINPNLFKVNLDQADFDFYNNLMNIPSLGEVPFTSPIAATAMLSYKYVFEGTFEEDGRLINKIKVIPRIEQGALFSGYIYIVEDSWNIKAVEFELPPAALLYYNHFKIFHDYEEVNGKWVLTREELYYNRRFAGSMLLGNTYIHFSNYQFDTTFARNYFRNELRIVEDEAVDRDSIFWEEVRPITLKEEERAYIAEQDSVIEYEKSEEYYRKADSAYNHINIWSFLVNGVYHRNSFKKMEYYFNPVIASMDPFGVGGYRHSIGGGMSKEFSKATEWDMYYDLNYGIVNEDLKGAIGMGYKYDPKRLARVYGGYENTFDAINSYESISNSFSRNNFVQLRSWNIGHQLELFNGFFGDVMIEYAQRESIAGFKLEEWSNQLFGADNIPVDFEGYDQLLFDFNFNIRFAQKYASEPYKKVILGSIYPKVDVHYKKAIPGIFNASLDFDFLEIKIHDEMKLGSMGVSKYKVFMGKFLRGDSIMFTDNKFFRGSDPFIFSSPLRSFQLLGKSFNTENEYFQLHYVHNFNGTLLNKVPLVSKLRLRTVAGASTLLIQDANFRHAEAFVGLELPFRLWKQVFKIGAYYVGADSNYSELASTFKIGIDLFNPYTNSWSY